MRIEDYLKCLGCNIKRARMRAGLRQIDVNAKAKLTYRHYQNIEAGKINLTMATLLRVAHAIGAPVEDLINGC